MKKVTSAFTLLLLIVISVVHAQSVQVYPTHWWVGMKMNRIQLMLHDTTGLQSGSTKVFVSYPGVTINKVYKADNPNYIFADLIISPSAKPGSFTIKLANAVGGSKSVAFQLKPRRQGNGTAFAQGLSSKDFVYLLMPDRFSNGDPSNDRIPGMRDQSLNRDSIYDRHGGDLQGVINHLDYLQELGVTSLWMTPVIENDRTYRTEHGYGFTDHYKIDRRYGGDAKYAELSNQLHKRGMKLVQDAVYNHVDIDHITFRDKPFKDWYHEWPVFTNPNYKDQTYFDPYASEYDKKKMEKGWFTPEMPDINQGNPFVANFLIQHAIWSVEEFGVDAWRIDTYIYVDQHFMNRCNKALMDEYPKITMFGEVWVSGTANEAFFTANKINTSFKSNMIGVTDFQTLFDGILPAVNHNDVNRMYQTLSNDFLYRNAMNNVVFLDNHDLTRFLTEVKDDTAKLKMGIAWLLTTRGIPQLYYGTEILMAGSKYPYDGNVRLDFKGGWNEDASNNKFTSTGRSVAENSIFNWTKSLANFRKNSPAITNGKLMQFAPENGVYVYFRYDGKQTVMCILNGNDKPANLSAGRFQERLKGFTNGIEVATGKQVSLTGTIEIPAHYVYVLELK
jgi:glycosidase